MPRTYVCTWSVPFTRYDLGCGLHRVLSRCPVYGPHTICGADIMVNVTFMVCYAMMNWFPLNDYVVYWKFSQSR